MSSPLSKGINARGYDTLKIETSEAYKGLLETVRVKSSESKKYIIAVDGDDCSGKSTVSRYLSWKMGVSVVEIDDYFVPEYSNKTLESYAELLKSKESNVKFLKEVVEKKQKIGRPIIIEGIVVLEILEICEVKPDFIIYMKNESFSNGTGFFTNLLLDYKNKHYSNAKPDCEFKW